MNPETTEIIDIILPPTPSLVERLAELMSSATTAQTVFAAPVERDGVTVIPVARAYYGFGGGSGSSPKTGPGSGGGGGAALTPVGFIEIAGGRARYRPIRSSVVPLVAVSGLVALLLLRSVPKLWARQRPRTGNKPPAGL